MNEKSTAKAMFASLCANYEGSKKVREAKALLLVHQYELFKMKDDENIEQMYSRFQSLVSGFQILKKSYVASDHVSKILRSLPARWRPKVTAIEEAKDLNTLSVEDLVSSLKAHEIGLNEHELAKKLECPPPSLCFSHLQFRLLSKVEVPYLAISLFPPSHFTCILVCK